jgi:hypothetical protein
MVSTHRFSSQFSPRHVTQHRDSHPSFWWNHVTRSLGGVTTYHWLWTVWPHSPLCPHWSLSSMENHETSRDPSNVRVTTGVCCCCKNDSFNDHNVLVCRDQDDDILTSPCFFCNPTPCVFTGGGVSVGHKGSNNTTSYFFYFTFFMTAWLLGYLF